MNKTQINHFESRMKRIVHGVVEEKILAKYPLKDGLTKQEKAGLIASGKARFREEKFTGPNCPYSPALFDYFEFPGEEDREAYNADMVSKINKARAKANKMAERLLDDFVLGRSTFEEAAEKMEAAVFWKEE